MPYQLQLLGEFVIGPGDGTGQKPRLNRKTRAILAYITATGRAHSRRALAQWFCQEARDPAGTLRWHLSQIRRRVGPEALRITRQDVRLNHGQVTCDHTRFRSAIDNLDACSPADLASAVALYRGPFLADLALPDAPEFELWLLGQRSRYQTLYEKGAGALLDSCIRARQWPEAMAVARRLLQTNPLLEAAQRRLIWLYARTGQRETALVQFEQCRDLLWQELAATPAAEIRELKEAIEHNRPLPDILPPAAAAARRPAGTDPGRPAPFIGRAEEMARLQQQWQQGGAVLLIDAPAGGGKTRLVQQFSNAIPARQLYGNCYESTRYLPYHPWLALLEQQLAALEAAALDRLAPHWRRQLGLLLPRLGDTAAAPNQQQLFRAVVHMLTDLDEAPAILLLEDLQWADEASLQLLQFTAQFLPAAGRHLMLVATYRSEEAGDNPPLTTLLADLGRLAQCSRLTLAPFTPGETVQLIIALWRELPAGFRSPHVRDSLLQATGGNPLFMTEILQELALADALPAELPLPPSLSELIARRLGQLPGSGRQVVESLAVLDQPARFELVQQISGRSEEEAITAIETGLRWRLLRLGRQNRIDFSHDLMRTAVAGHISPIRRQRLHQRAARFLGQSRAEPATIAYHWERAGNQEQASRYALLAAQRATRLYAIDEAINYYRRAIPHLPEMAQRLEAMRQLGRLYQRISDWEQAAQVLTEGLAAVAPGSADAARFQVLLGQLYSRQSHYRRALSLLRAAYQTCQTLDDAGLRAQCVGTMGIVHYFRDAYDQSLACYQEALALAEAEADEENRAVWLSNIATIHLETGQHAAALTHLQQAVAVQERLGNQEQLAVGLGNLGDLYRAIGQFEQAITHHEKALQIRHQWGDQAGVATNLRQLGVDYADIGATEPALTCFWQALTLDITLGRRDACGLVLGHLGDLLAARDKAAAAAALDTAVSLLRRTQSRHHLCRFLLAQANLWWSSASWPQIEAALAEAAALAAGTGHADLQLRARLLGVRLQVARGQLEADAAVRQLAAAAGGDDADAAVGYAIWQIDPAQSAWRQKAAARYRQLYHRSPKAEYRQRYAALTGEALPPAAAPAPPPTPITPLATSLSPYLQPLQSLLAS